MSDYITDEQQVEKLRAWWKEYGMAVTFGVVIAIAIVVGWQMYRRHEIKKAEHASLIYATMMSSAHDKAFKSATDAANTLTKDYSGSAYSDLANLWLAKHAVAQKQYKVALEKLLTVQVHGDMKTLRQLAAIRRAEIYLQLKQPEQALAAVGQVYNDSYLPRIDAVKGDAYFQMGKVNEARNSYQQANVGMQKASLASPLLEMKLADLPAPSPVNTTTSMQIKKVSHKK